VPVPDHLCAHGPFGPVQRGSARADQLTGREFGCVLIRVCARRSSVFPEALFGALPQGDELFLRRLPTPSWDTGAPDRAAAVHPSTVARVRCVHRCTRRIDQREEQARQPHAVQYSAERSERRRVVVGFACGEVAVGLPSTQRATVPGRLGTQVSQLIQSPCGLAVASGSPSRASTKGTGPSGTGMATTTPGPSLDSHTVGRVDAID